MKMEFVFDKSKLEESGYTEEQSLNIIRNYFKSHICRYQYQVNKKSEKLMNLTVSNGITNNTKDNNEIGNL